MCRYHSRLNGIVIMKKLCVVLLLLWKLNSLKYVSLGPFLAYTHNPVFFAMHIPLSIDHHAIQHKSRVPKGRQLNMKVFNVKYNLFITLPKNYYTSPFRNSLPPRSSVLLVAYIVALVTNDCGFWFCNYIANKSKSTKTIAVIY